ncbi:MFS transporter [Nocardia sp. AB354]|uniref:MFS transporter n=1 Tax=Nocardia sp. AB354 TaxID=3413283 RepID=UPI003C244547
MELSGSGYRAAAAQEVLLGVTGMAVIAQLYLSVPLSPDVAQSFPGAETPTIFGGSFGGSYATGFLLLSRPVGRSEPRTAIVLALSSLAITTLFTAQATSWTELVGARALQGLSASAFTPALLAFIARQLPSERKSTAAGLTAAFFLSAVAVAQVGGQELEMVIGWRGVLLIFAAAYGIAAVTLAAILPSARTPDTFDPAADRVTWRVNLLVLGRGEFRALLLITLTALAGLVALYSAASRSHVLSASEVQAVRLAAIPALAMAWPAGRLLSRVDLRNVLRIGLATCAVGELAATVLVENGLVVAGFVIGVELSSLGVAMVVPALMEAVRRADPSGAIGPSAYPFCLFVGATAGGAVVAPPGPLCLSLSSLHLLAATASASYVTSRA